MYNLNFAAPKKYHPGQMVDAPIARPLQLLCHCTGVGSEACAYILYMALVKKFLLPNYTFMHAAIVTISNNYISLKNA